MRTIETKLSRLVREKKEIEYRLRYASRQGWATEIYQKELKDNKNARIFEASQANALAEYQAY